MMSCLIEALKAIPDHRKARGKRHPLWVLLLLILMGMRAGYRGYRPLQTFTAQYNQSLSELLGLDLNGVPSFSTFRRTMMEIDLEALSDAFEAWMLQQPELLSLSAGAEAIDGKRIHQPIETADGKQRMVGLVSLFAGQSGVSLKLHAITADNHHEIEVVRTLLKSLKLEGLIIMMDALHTQKTLEAVIESGNDYQAAVKGNQPTLLAHLTTFSRHVKRSRIRHGKVYDNESYYIISVQTSAEQWQTLIQHHWGIEHRLHWPQNVLLNEDATRLESAQALIAGAMIKSFVINILRLKGH